DQIPELLPTLKKGGLFFVPLMALTVALLMGYTPTFVAVIGAIAVLAVAMVRPRTRIGPLKLIGVLSETCYRMVPVAGACAAAGLVIGGITMTGLAGKLAHLVYGITEAQMLPSLIIAAFMTIVLGMGMPTPSAYILAAAMMSPLLTDLGIPVLAAHMFVLYFAVMSALTPPVAVAAYAAASIAEDNPLYIAILAVKFALAAFLVPFAFVYGNELLMVGPISTTLISFASAAVGLILLAAAIEGHLDRPLSQWFRLLLALAGAGLVIPDVRTSLGGLALLTVLFAPRALAMARSARK
ncbi:MAG: TRAP transporter large permease subunit, partial [Rhodospirillales bacterium]|nr:TRAP transporter large permease subunit [Rhodospirillales bacterium]